MYLDLNKLSNHWQTRECEQKERKADAHTFSRKRARVNASIA